VRQSVRASGAELINQQFGDEFERSQRLLVENPFFNTAEKKSMQNLMSKKYQANQFLQGAESSLDTDYTSDLLRGSTVKRPKPTSRYNQSPIELVHLARIVPQQTEDVRKHYICIVMLN